MRLSQRTAEALIRRDDRDYVGDAQIIAIVKQAQSGIPVAERCRQHSIRSATFYQWRSQYGGMDASLMCQRRQLQDDNRRLKKRYAEAQLSADWLKQAMAKKWSSPAVAG